MFVRASKFRHVYGSVAKKELCYEGLHFTQSTHDGSFCAVNPQFLAVVIESAGGGAFVVLPLDKVPTPTTIVTARGSDGSIVFGVVRTDEILHEHLP